MGSQPLLVELLQHQQSASKSTAASALARFCRLQASVVGLSWSVLVQGFLQLEIAMHGFMLLLGSTCRVCYLCIVNHSSWHDAVYAHRKYVVCSKPFKLLQATS